MIPDLAPSDPVLTRDFCFSDTSRPNWQRPWTKAKVSTSRRSSTFSQSPRFSATGLTLRNFYSLQFTILHTLGKEMETLNEIYEAYQAYLDFEERWKALTWKKIDLDLINKEVQSVEEVLQRLKEKYSKAETLEEIVKRKDQVFLAHSKEL